jgi:hypothetical protein
VLAIVTGAGAVEWAERGTTLGEVRFGNGGAATKSRCEVWSSARTSATLTPTRSATNRAFHASKSS